MQACPVNWFARLNKNKFLFSLAANYKKHMAKRRTGLSGTDNKRRKSHSPKTKKRLEAKKVMLESRKKR